MEHLDTNQRVNDRRAAREHEAENHRLVMNHDDVPAKGEPRLRYVRKNRTLTLARQTLAGR